MSTASILDNISIVLCNTTHNGNIGSAARAMKTMGLHKLVLVAPAVRPDDHSLALASNARDVLNNAWITDTLEQALHDTSLAYAMTSRKREFNSHLATPRESTPEIFAAINNNEKVSIVFGCERSGLTIEQLERCNRMITIPGNPEYFSLNLAQAVQIMAYEIYSSYSGSVNHLKTAVKKSSFADNQGILNHLDQILLSLNYYATKNPELTKRRLQNIIHKANLDREEVDLIRGILRRIETSTS